MQISSHVPFTAFVLLLVSLSLFTSCSQRHDHTDDAAEPNINRRSPIAIASVSYEDTYLKVVYGQPYRNGREVFGDLVPYGEVWRTGANEATELTVTETINFGGKTLEAGTYALFTIPFEQYWTVILNNQLGQWGAFEYDPDYDELRVQIPVEKTEQIAEAFTITFPKEVTDGKTTMRMRWEEVSVSVPVRFTE